MPDNSDRDFDRDDDFDPEDDLRELLRGFLSGDSDIDPSKLAGVAGLPGDPAQIAQLMSKLQDALQNSGDGINWGLALEQAKAVAGHQRTPSLPAERSALEQAFHVAALWLDDVTFISEITSTPRLISRTEWVTATMPIWTQLAEPVATSIADALTRVLHEQSPEDMGDMIAGASKLMRNVGGTLFAMQLGQAVGQLSTEVVSGGDVGIPLLGGDDGSADGAIQAAIIPQNLDAFGAGLDIELEQVRLYLAVRELAHARLFRHAKWLRLQMLTSITEIARGISIDTTRLESLVEDFDPSNTESLQRAVSQGELLAPKNEQQLAALARLETTLALIEGWVDVVTADATTRLPKSGAIAETVRRRRASGGPAESAISTLVGLELRPRRLREAAAMWQQLTDAVGAERRDALWSHPDLIPSSEDIDDPAALIARITNPDQEPDDVDRAIEELLGDPDGDRPIED
ncbi:putative hydrolase [Cryobacterium mesophilum]|uniref:Zinc-dependent metalloprotease n=1 Tax=Terrimesophilobacter mesophilus TaxID=433647 RepID=A0A4R8VFD3_9MICO|nr:zinc-dependent metalloprotease [Terrimesophilobacter mesophilus]MBB5633871.1 putative hydrolase [Terrimesophilobacter mesophilus]TFB80547.1 zinc-dependent metalloprotease [Terrimesophilobacter mesophilus]